MVNEMDEASEIERNRTNGEHFSKSARCKVRLIERSDGGVDGRNTIGWCMDRFFFFFLFSFVFFSFLFYSKLRETNDQNDRDDDTN